MRDANQMHSIAEPECAQTPSRCLRVNLFTVGDSADINTWSNFPFFFSKSLLQQGISVNRIDLIPRENRCYRMYRTCLRNWTGLLRRLFGAHREYDFFRDRVTAYLVNRKIRIEARRAADVDFNIFLTFSFSSHRYARTPVVHLCDISYEHFLEHTGGRKRWSDAWFIKAERRNLEGAHMIFGLDPKCCDFLRERYGLQRVRRFTSGINLEMEDPGDVEDFLERKWNARKILFIGRGIRKRGIDILVRAFEIFNGRNSHAFSLDIVGASEDQLGAVGDRVRCCEYLDKSRPDDLKRYCELLRSATVFVMPMREGPFPGVVKEAALAFTPAIISNVWNAGRRVEHGYNGIVVECVTPEAFADEMHALAHDRRAWERLARNARESAGTYSWDRGVEDLLEAITAGRAGRQAQRS